MSKKKSTSGCLSLVVLVAIGAVAYLILRDKPPAARPAQPSAATAPTVTASLSNFTVDRANSSFVFTLDARNSDTKEKTVYAVVYGRNDMISPPRRQAWPLAGLFLEAGTRRGRLSPSDVSANWNTRREESKGAKLVLKPHGAESLEGALVINSTSLHEAWKGQRIDPRYLYDEVSLWLFSSQGGRLIFEKTYKIK